MAKVVIDIDLEIFEDLVVNSLIDSYQIQLKERDFEKRRSKNDLISDDLRAVANTNYEHSKKFVKALRTVIKYYTTTTQRREMGFDF